jgi:hypothetical protein
MILNLLAADITNPAIEGVGASSGAEFVAKLIPALITGLFVLGIVAFLFMFLTGGIQWMNAGGDRGKLEDARRKVVNAVVGLFILLMLIGIVNLLEVFFHTNLTTVSIDALKFGAQSSTGPGPGPGPGPGTGLSECPCGGGGLGQCASNGQSGQITYGGACYRCEAGTGWVFVGGTCGVISCGTCP